MPTALNDFPSFYNIEKVFYLFQITQKKILLIIIIYGKKEQKNVNYMQTYYCSE